MSKYIEHARIVPAVFDDGWVLEIDGEVQSHVDLSQPHLIRFEYLRRIGNVLDITWPRSQPVRILHLGAGALTLVRYVQATRPGSSQTVIELEPELIPLVTSELPLPEGTKLIVLTGDARSQLQNLGEQHFDAIIVDIFTGHDTATHLTERVFYRELLQRLTERGILLVNIGDDEGLEFFTHQAQVLHQTALDLGLNGAWTLADASTLNHRRAGNAVLAAGGGFPTDHNDVSTLRSQLSAMGPYPASVLTPDETVALGEKSADEE